MEASSHGGGGRGVNFQACRQRTKRRHGLRYKSRDFSLSLSFFAISTDKEDSSIVDFSLAPCLVDTRLALEKGFSLEAIRHTTKNDKYRGVIWTVATLKN